MLHFKHVSWTSRLLWKYLWTFLSAWYYFLKVICSFAANIILVKPEFNLREAHWLGTKYDSRWRLMTKVYIRSYYTAVSWVLSRIMALLWYNIWWFPWWWLSFGYLRQQHDNWVISVQKLLTVPLLCQPKYCLHLTNCRYIVYGAWLIIYVHAV